MLPVLSGVTGLLPGTLDSTGGNPILTPFLPITTASGIFSLPSAGVYIVEIVQVLGLVAGAFTTISFVPQVIKALRTKSVHDLSLIMLVLFMLGLVLWLVYGIILTAWPIILANSITLVLSAVLLYFKVRYR